MSSDLWWAINFGHLSYNTPGLPAASDAEVESELATLVARMVAYLSDVSTLDQVIEMARLTKPTIAGANPSGYPRKWHLNATTASAPADLLAGLGDIPG